MRCRTKVVAPQLPTMVGEDTAAQPTASSDPIADTELEQPTQSVAMQEVLGCPARWIADLPLATTLLASRAHGGGRLLLTTSRAAHAAAQSAQVPAFVGSEITALARAAEHDRATAQVLEGWCAAKLADPSFRLTPELAVDLPSGLKPHRNWTVGQVLRAYGAELVQVCTGSEVPL